MIQKSKINLAVVIYGDKNQLPVNNQQFLDLKKILKSFNLSKYNFKQRDQLVKDFRKGNINLVLKNSYGRGNENDIEKFLEKNKIPFMGSNSKVTLTGTSKYLSKKVFRKNKISVVDDIYVNKKRWAKSKKRVLNQIEKNINYPCIIKDTGGTDSRGLYFVQNEKQAIKAIQRILNRKRDIIIEKFIKADYEVTCMVIGNSKPIAYEPVGMGNNDIGALLSGSKKDKMQFKVEVPTTITPKLRKKVKQLSVKAHKSLNCSTFSRADILIKDNKLYLLEVDVHPGFRSNSATFLSAKYQKETPDKLFKKLYKLVTSK
ncbi:MAG: ATP-grasp domain-containing protein [Candidatus Kerfeldbacteria bacterium]|jgi:D-alanine-D-alanine ligase